MGNVHSISPGALVGGAVVVGGVVYYTYTQPPPSHSSVSQAQSSSTSSSKKGKKKKKATGAAENDPIIASSSKADDGQPVPRVVSFPTVIPGQFDTESIASDEPVSKSQPKKSKKKKPKAKSSAISSGAVSSAESATPVPTAPAPSKSKQRRTPPLEPASSKGALKSSPSFDTGTDGSWTRVESSARKAKQASDAAGTTGTEDSTSVTEKTDDDIRPVSTDNRRTLAEKLLPKPRKTGVDDMLETPDYPPLSRVMRVQPRPDEKPASGFSWGDYEDVNAEKGGSVDAEGVLKGGAENDADGEGDDDDNDGWGVVKTRRPKTIRDPSSQFAAQSSSQSSQSAEQSKRQRQNAAKRDAQKAAKASAESDRLATLAKHKRELERTKMMEQFASGGGKKAASGGMKASVDSNGKLIWE